MARNLSERGVRHEVGAGARGEVSGRGPRAGRPGASRVFYIKGPTKGSRTIMSM